MLVFSEADRLRYQFGENFERNYADRIRHLRQLYKVHLIPKANHVLSDTSSVNELLEVAIRWLTMGYPPEPLARME